VSGWVVQFLDHQSEVLLDASADSALTRAVAHKAMYIARLCAISRSSIRASFVLTDCLCAIPGPVIPREYFSKKIRRAPSRNC
jgi:hypothetical protein